MTPPRFSHQSARSPTLALQVFVDPKGPGLANDMWAIGVITHMLLTAAHPFDDNGKADDDTIRRNICYGEPNFEDWTASEQAKQFVLMLLRKDPKQRLSIEQLLQHPWIWDQDAASTHGSGTGGTGGMGDDGAAAAAEDCSSWICLCRRRTTSTKTKAATTPLDS